MGCTAFVRVYPAPLLPRDMPSWYWFNAHATAAARGRELGFPAQLIPMSFFAVAGVTAKMSGRTPARHWFTNAASGIAPKGS
eukprot:30676-Pelagococcus_subviridis.AAC.2